MTRLRPGRGTRFGVVCLLALTVRPGAARPEVSRQADDVPARVRAALASLDAGATPGVVMPALLAGLQDPDTTVRIQAAEGVRRLGHDGAVAVPLLAEVLRHPDARLRTAAADALVAIGRVAVPVLVEWARAPERDARLEALVALARVGPAAVAAVQAMGVTLADPDPRIRAGAATVLGAIGPDAAAAVPALTALAARDEDAAARRVAADALARIVPPPETHDTARCRRIPAALVVALGFLVGGALLVGIRVRRRGP